VVESPKIGETNSTMTSSSPSQKFLSNTKQEQYYKVRYACEFNKFLNSSKTELDNIHKVYAENYDERDVETQDVRWKTVILLKDVIFEEDWSDYRRNKLLRDLHDNFYELSSNRFISRPNFETGIVKACQTNCSSSATTTRKTLTMAAMSTVYNSFDVHSQNVFNWKQFIYYFYFLLDPTKCIKDQLLLAFKRIVGNSNNKLSSIDLQELGIVLYPLVKTSAIDQVLCAFDDAWSQVKATQQHVDDDNIESTKLTQHIFEQMLELQVLQCFFEQSDSAWGRGRVFPVYISQWEENLYNNTILELVKTSRRDAAVSDKLKRDRYKSKLHVWQIWLDYAKYQSSLRCILCKINHRMALRRKSRGLFAFKHWTIMQHAALDIQRVCRGFFGRNRARHHWLIYDSATLIQTRYRIHVAKTILHSLQSQYLWAIVTVQSAIRGALARRLALRKLMTLVEQQHLKNIKERERYEFERGVWSLTRLQSFRRRQLAIATAVALRQKQERELRTQRLMEAERKMFLRERQIYERQLEEFYISMKEEHIANTQVQDKIDQDRVKVNTLRRRLSNEEMKDAEPDRELEERVAIEKWKSEWQIKIEAGVKDMKLHSIHCLDQPDNAVEKQTRKAIRKRIKTRLKEVLRRADEQGLRMETKEGKVIAREEIIHIIGEEERSRLNDETDKAFIERNRLKEEERIQELAKQRDAHKRATIYAVSLVATACRRWLARKELRRLCLETYEKIFETSSHSFYYRNKVTGETSWSKPKAMGIFEIPAKDEWKLLRDAHNFPYYYNPLLMQMSWTPPRDVEMCCGTVPHTWWYSVRMGQCPNFSCVLNEDDGKRYCQECYNSSVGEHD